MAEVECGVPSVHSLGYLQSQDQQDILGQAASAAEVTCVSCVTQLTVPVVTRGGQGLTVLQSLGGGARVARKRNIFD